MNQPASIIRPFNNKTFYGGEFVSLTPLNSTWRTRLSLSFWVITFDLSDIGGHTCSYATASIAMRII